MGLLNSAGQTFLEQYQNIPELYIGNYIEMSCETTRLLQPHTVTYSTPATKIDSHD